MPSEVSGAGDTAGELALQALYEAKVAAELCRADALVPGSDLTPVTGSHFPSVLAVKGLPGPAEQAGGGAMSGADGAAFRKAVAALGLDPNRVAAVLTQPVECADSDRIARRLRLTVEALDPDSIIAVDRAGAADCARALGLAKLVSGRPVRAAHRTLLAVDGLEASLGDETRKRTVWAQLRKLAAG